MTRPTAAASERLAKRLDEMREQLVYLRGAGQLRGAPGWAEWKSFVEKLVRMLDREEQHLLNDCADNGEFDRIKESRPPREAWQLVADVRAARRAKRMVETVLTAVERNEDAVTALTQEIASLERRKAEHDEELKSFGGDHAED